MREKLAALAHRQWSGWMRYMLSEGTHHVDGSITLPLPLVARWMRQMNTPYKDLPESEKNADRYEADKVIGLVTINLPVIIMRGLEA